MYSGLQNVNGGPPIGKSMYADCKLSKRLYYNCKKKKKRTVYDVKMQTRGKIDIAK